jgi:23S rRNA (cytidine2498-2'-O)-methyltransferase
MTTFLYCAGQAAAQRLLKAEVKRCRPDLRPAYARPGLITFKADPAVSAGAGLDALAPLVFARVTGRSVATVAEGAVEQVVAAARAAGATRVHAWRRGDDEAPLPELRAALAAAAGLDGGERPRAGEVVLDVVTAPGEPWFLGVHAHGPGRSPYSGGLIPVDVPADAPSRAYRKIEEAIAWSGARPRAGETALEIGSAPGGASHALLRRGLSVVGVDPGEMAEVVRAAPRFRHLQVAAGGLRREQLPARVDWLLLDVNLAPQVALHAVRRIVPMVRRTLRGAFFTLKLNEERFAEEIPALLERVRGYGFAAPRATQLPSNRSEICVYAVPRATDPRVSARRPRG